MSDVVSIQETDRAERRRMLAKARRLRIRADDLAGAGRYSEAIECLEEVVRICPADGRSFLRMGALYQETCKFEPSLAAMRRAVEIDPRHREARELLIQALADLGRYAEAVTGCNDLLGLYPSNLFAREVLCLASMQSGELSRALRLSSELIAMDPSNPHHHFKRAMLLQQQGDTRAAVQAYERVLKEAAENSEVYEEADSALYEIDERQIQKIAILLDEDRVFALKFERNPDTVLQRGFFLSEAGMQRLMLLSETAGFQSRSGRADIVPNNSARYYN